jgi:oligoendopeptidase F
MPRLKSYLIVIITLLFVVNSFPQTKERKEIPEKYKWNLTDLFASVADWKSAKTDVSSNIDKIESYKGKLDQDAGTLLNAMDLYFNTLKEYFRFATYSGLLADEDLSISSNQALRQEASTLGTKFSESTAWIRPEILEMDPAKVKDFFAKEPKLDQYKMYIEDIQRMRAHTLSADQEKILASFGLITDTPSDVYNVFNNAEMPYSKVTLSTGEEVTLTNSAYTKYRSTGVREDRAKIFDAFFNKYGKFENTIGANYAGKVKTDWVYAKDRNYESSLAASVDGPNIPVTVYTNLIKQIHNSLPTLQRFLKLKKQMLGVDTLHYYDLYTPLVKKVDMNFTVEQGEDIIKKALAPMGEDYIATLNKAFGSGWIDFLPNVGKRSGAYSSGSAYDVHPYILMNWNDDYESVSTLAHELGHTMHSYFSSKNQPFATADYPTFVAEIASTFNENLLNHYMVAHSKSDEEKLYLLGSYLDLLRTTIFRQTLFAEFELKVHEMAENQQPITGEDLSKMYYDLVKEYYGNDKGICVVDPYVAYEWEYIPHFVNYTYYVYQYSTSLIYSTAFAEKVLQEGKPAVDKYYNILKGGSSEYPIELIKKAGIDPLSAEPFELTMKKMNDVMDQMEEILSKK